MPYKWTFFARRIIYKPPFIVDVPMFSHMLIMYFPIVSHMSPYCPIFSIYVPICSNDCPMIFLCFPIFSHDFTSVKSHVFTIAWVNPLFPSMPGLLVDHLMAQAIQMFLPWRIWSVFPRENPPKTGALNGKINFEWSFFFAMFDFQRVY